MKTIIDFKDKSPKIDATCFIADGCQIIGDVVMHPDSSIWFNSIARGDVCGIRIGSRTNIQDGCILHGDTGSDLIIGEGVTVGHRAILHGCSIGNDTLIGMGSIVLDGARIGSGCIIGAGALVTADTVIPDASLVLGIPGKIIRTLTDAEMEGIKANTKRYLLLKESYK
jgi:carbonic anhydrase/acetyltransferase-like protein (isoleucine patch superfamily)